MKRGDARTLSDMATYTFTQPQCTQMKSQIAELIQRADQDLLATIAGNTFSVPNAEQLKDLIELLIERGDQKVRRILNSEMTTKTFFRGPGWENILTKLRVAPTASDATFLIPRPRSDCLPSLEKFF